MINMSVNKRKCLSVREKVEIIRELEFGEKTENVWEECKKGYTKEEIYNADKTELFYNMTPDTTFKYKGEKCVSGKN
jgi:hypothetical protein